jgi:hypothetical protein
MSSNSEFDSLVPLRSYPGGSEASWSEPAPVQAPALQPEMAYPAPAETSLLQPAVVQPAAVGAPRRRGWVGVVAVAVIGLIVAGTLGYLLYSTTGQRDAALRHAAATQATLDSREATLASTQSTLAASQQDLAARNASAAYASTYVTDSGRVRIDYQKLLVCNSFGACRTAAQSALNDLQAFQSDRSAATVPPAIASSDGMLRDAISAAIAADQEVISGFDTFSVSKVMAGSKKLNAAMLSMGKAEAVLGPVLK